MKLEFELSLLYLQPLGYPNHLTLTGQQLPPHPLLTYFNPPPFLLEFAYHNSIPLIVHPNSAPTPLPTRSIVFLASFSLILVNLPPVEVSRLWHWGLQTANLHLAEMRPVVSLHHIIQHLSLRSILWNKLNFHKWKNTFNWLKFWPCKLLQRYLEKKKIHRP